MERAAVTGQMLIALFAEMERTFAAERTAHARAVAAASRRLAGRPLAPPYPGRFHRLSG
ncbi:hypothetical protein ACIRPX_40265 [Streptomyces sp. NPDC101225]|uniref:hypothetical protein n=1 Tax=Streptomyces sp. NPDC101225 TaxID=3366135 RepID=UPI003808920C